MDVTTIEMPKDEALEAFRAYRDSLRERHDEEAEQIMRGYRELARGKRLLNLPEVVSEAGLDDAGLPRLAICRADEKWCSVLYRREGNATFTGFKTPGWSGDEHHRAPTRRVRLPAGTFPPITETRRSRDGSEFPEFHREGRTMVPLVPPPFRPKAHLRNNHVLWEVEKWEPQPPRDPILLKRMGGDLFAVVAMWDLTDLERAVLRGRAEQLS